MVEVDRIMVDDLGIDLVRMMENAGRGLARLARASAIDGSHDRVVVLAGRGGNGGGALVAARRLTGWGIPVEVFLSRPMSEYRDVPRQQGDILNRMGVALRVSGMDRLEGDPLIVDGLIGYSLSGPPRGRTADLIEWANSAGAPIVSLDVPSGVDASTGAVPGAAICAIATLTLALPKTGLFAAEAPSRVGDLYLADIGVPASLYANAFGIDVEGLFDKGDVLRLVTDDR
jgi:NAD(P)H-hydrate epimerase